MNIILFTYKSSYAKAKKKIVSLKMRAFFFPLNEKPQTKLDLKMVEN